MSNSVTAENNDETLPVASLRLLAPPLRLVSAAVWKVMQQRDVMQYGKLEEFVSSVIETVPGLLNYRHQAKLTVGLQARLILEQLNMSQSPDPELILPQLERLRAPTLSEGKRKDQKVEMAVKNFHTLVHTLLKNPAGRKRFFQEEFGSQYGPQYDLALEKLMWEFLSRLDQLLPVPDLAQTVSWLSAAPAVLEECARSASQPQLLRTLLQHEKCLGHLNSAASISSSIGDSILSSLSLPPSGKVCSTDLSESTPTTNTASSPALSTKSPSSSQTSRTVSQIAPVIGIISSKDLPQQTSTNQDMASCLDRDSDVVREASAYTRVKSRSRQKHKSSENVLEQEHFVGNMLVTVLSQTSTSSEVEESDEAELRPVRKSTGLRRSVTKKRETRRSTRVRQQGRKKSEEGLKNLKNDQKVAEHRASQKDKQLSADLASCMSRQLRVMIPRLDISGITQPLLHSTMPKKEQNAESLKQLPSVRESGARAGDSESRKRKLDYTWTPEKTLTSAMDKQLCSGSPCIPMVKLVRLDGSGKGSPMIKSTDDIIYDSEDEATAKVKGRLFTTRYCKTKSNTYVPTLQEFWAPAFLRRDFISPGNGCR